MTTFFAVFTEPDTAMPNVFWGAFATKELAEKAVAEYVETNTYWNANEFYINEFPFGELL